MAHGMVITPPCGFFFFDRSFDSSLRLCLQDWMPSLMGGTSGGFREPTNGCLNGTASAVAGSSAAWACLLLLGLIFAGVVVGGGLILVGARISASPPRSLAAGPATPAFTILAVRWPNKGWSRPLLPDHGELAASEQAQLEAARARRGWRPIRRALSSSTHRHRSFQFPPRCDARRVDARRFDARRVNARRVNARRVDAAFRRVVLLPASGPASAQLPPRDVGSSLHHAALLSARSSLRRAAHDACGPTPTASISKLQYISSSWPQS